MVMKWMAPTTLSAVLLFGFYGWNQVSEQDIPSPTLPPSNDVLPPPGPPPAVEPSPHTLPSPSDDLILQELKSVLKRHSSEPNAFDPSLRTWTASQEPPSLPMAPAHAGPPRELPWDAIETLLRSARMLDQHARRLLAQGDRDQADRVGRAAGRIRQEAAALLGSGSGTALTSPINTY
jgi:hypothetical protein